MSRPSGGVESGESAGHESPIAIIAEAAMPHFAEEVQEAIEETFEDLHPWMPWAKEVQPLEETREFLANSERKFADGEDSSLGIVKEQSNRGTFVIAGLTTVLCWALFALRLHDPASQAVLILGNIVVGAGVLLIVLAMGALRERGAPERGQDFAATTELVRGGVYGVVRHPLYLGWLLTYPAAMMVSQHWLIVVLGASGMVSLVAIARTEDSELLAKFGSAYEEYMAEVPRLNIIGGVMRKLGWGRQGGRAA